MPDARVNFLKNGYRKNVVTSIFLLANYFSKHLHFFVDTKGDIMAKKEHHKKPHHKKETAHHKEQEHKKEEMMKEHHKKKEHKAK